MSDLGGSLSLHEDYYILTERLGYLHCSNSFVLVWSELSVASSQILFLDFSSVIGSFRQAGEL